MGAPELTPDQERLRNIVVEATERCEQGEYAYWTKRWDHFWALYSGYQELKANMADRRDRRDRDMGLQAAMRDWGSSLHIPYVFATIETQLPRLLAQRPLMAPEPRTPRSDRNVQNVKWMVDSQQEQCRYELKLQSIAKSGLTFGLGAGKTLWRTSVKTRPTIERAIFSRPGIDFVQGDPEQFPLWDDPDVMVLNIRDLFWDPAGYDMETVGYMVHRNWRTTDYVMRRLESGAWNLTPELTAEIVQGTQRTDHYKTSRAAERKAQGQANYEPKGAMHEVLEYHNGEDIITVLNRTWPVMMGKNPDWRGVMPFDIYRPTERLHQFVGIGEPEAIEDLQIEMNVLRGQRRDNATLKLMETFAVEEGVIDLDDFKMGPGKVIEVQGLPNEVLKPLTVGDIPHSGYAEEDRLRSDIERVSGLSDVTAGGGQASQETATGAQLVLAATNARIALKARRVELEVAAPQCEKFVILSQRRIVSAKDVRVPIVPQPGEPDRRWAWVQLGPEEIAGEYAWKAEGGLQPPNVPQDRQDAMFYAQSVLPLPFVDKAAIMSRILELMGEANPQQFIAPDPSLGVPPVMLPILAQLLEQQGADPAMVKGLIGQALVLAQRQQAEETQGPVQSGDPNDPAAAQGVLPAGAAASRPTGVG